MRLSQEERKAILDNMRDLLDKYDYEYTDDALDIIVDEWETKKGALIDAFKKHPKYIDGKFMIAFDTDFDREIDRHEIYLFSDYLRRVMDWAVDKARLPEAINEERKEHGCRWLPRLIFDNIFMDFSDFDSRTLTPDQAEAINEAIPEIRAKKGEKTSRVINRVCTFLHYNEHPDYNREFAKYADALSPLKIKRHTILSINPIDYLTMSFGNSWASCHTIDKENKRGMPNSYSGCYSSGTMSYMLDGVSMVLYVVDKSYDGTDYFFQDKINRQMFHYGEDKLVQGRLYPQSCDGDDAEYTTYRNVVQEIIATIFDFPNLWTVSRSIGDYVRSQGTHYRDYNSFSSCRISIKKDTDNLKPMTIGAEPICIDCGETHHVEDNISCCGKYVYCEDCGERIPVDDAHYIDGDPYCSNCCSWCEWCDNWVRSDITRVNGYDVCEDCLDEHFYRCERCGEYVHEDDVFQHHFSYYCEDCYNDVLEEEACDKAEEEEDTPENQSSQWRVVDRPPVVGDYIRLRHEIFTFNRVGDILRIDGLRVYDMAFVIGINHPRDTGHPNQEWNYPREYYDILEKVTEEA